VRAWWIACAIAVVAHGTASAESKADKMFKKGKRQLAQKKYAAACATFERVDQLDPGIGAKLNVARCFEEWGKLARAYDWYAEAHKMAKTNKDKRAGKIKQLIEALDQDVPRLTLKIPVGIDAGSAQVKLDAKPFPADQFGKEQRVDPGQHAIEYMSADQPQKKTVSLDRGGMTEIELPIEPSKSVPGDKDKDHDRDKDKDHDRDRDKDKDHPMTVDTGPSRNWRKLSGIAAGSAGIVGLGVASVLTITARSSYKDALDANCRGDTSMCDATGLSKTRSARHRANIATVVSIASAVAVGTGVFLYLTAPKSHRDEHALHVVPAVGDHEAGLVVLGGF